MINMSKLLNISKPKKKHATCLTTLTLLSPSRVTLFIPPPPPPTTTDVLITFLLTHTDFYLGTIPSY